MGSERWGRSGYRAKGARFLQGARLGTVLFCLQGLGVWLFGFEELLL